MIKAIFIDYTGTIMEETGKEMTEIVRRCCQNSNVKDSKEVLSYWWKHLKEYEQKSYQETYITEDEIVDRLLEKCEKELGLKDDFEQLHRLFQEFWMHAPAFADTKEFFETCSLPIYIISNNGCAYIEESMREKDLHPAGIISGDMVRAYKPHREIFEKALEVSGCKACEVLHIGDSVESDVFGAKAVGICPVLLDRSAKSTWTEGRVIHSLKEVRAVVEEKNRQDGEYDNN